MNRKTGVKYSWKDFLCWALLLLSALLLLWAAVIDKAPGDTEQAAGRVERILEGKVARLDRYIDDAMATESGEWMHLDALPRDMVIYRYAGDTLQSWDNTFTVANDNISPTVIFQRLANPKSSFFSPLSDLTDTLSYVNIGQSWYLAKAVQGTDCTVVAGLEVVNELDGRSANSVNPDLRLSDKFSIVPLATSGGSGVTVSGVPQFKVVQDVLESPLVTDSSVVWLALVCFVAALLLFLSLRRSLGRFCAVLLCILVAMAGVYFWGTGIRRESKIFSPVLYADGTFLYSLGAVLIVNLAILSASLCIHLVRKRLYRAVRKCAHPKAALLSGSALTIAAVALILVYTNLTFRSIVLNSSICLELYRLADLTLYSALVYASFLTMLLSVPILLQLLRPAAKEMLGVRFDAFSVSGRMVFAFAVSLFLVQTAASLGIRKEQNKVEVWANRLSVERDISLELQLRRVENSIANDYFIASLSVLPNASGTILNRIVDSYMYSISQNYDISVVLLDENESDPALRAFFNERVRSGVRIHDNSRFLYTKTVSGHPRYSGLFTYFNQRYGASYMIVGVEPKSSREFGGYASLLDISDPGKVSIPSRYSYAKYNDRALVSYKGNYAYPTVMSEEMLRAASNGDGSFVSDTYVHFINDVSNGETVIISRKTESGLTYAVAVIFIALVSYIVYSAAALTRRRRKVFKSSYFKNRITTVLMFSLIVTLIALAAVSVFFVYERNEDNRQKMMSDKINSIQTIMSAPFRYVDDYRQAGSQELSSLMENASNMAKTDITLYSPAGKAFKSTAPEVFDRQLLSDRMNADAYESIVFGHKRYFINRESVGPNRYYSLYAPLFNDSGRMAAILCAPYTDESYDFEMEAVMHSVMIVCVFLILLLLARFLASAIVDRMLQPLVEIGRRMNRTDIDNLEIIEYDREDEISTLVSAYNLMVEDLAESTKQLAQAERDKAWSSMARQVAHEIKNPLTPMKLQLQRLIRLKQRNAPGWEEKFDDVAKVVLDHIDILTDTANEFSTFAKLYTEEPTSIDLDALLQEEISMFDGREGISFEYIGTRDAVVSGPKPQLTRVFVNLITNAIQAVDIRRQDMLDAGGEPFGGQVRVSLRNSSSDGYYDIVFEDNGPGVSPENQSKLFTPNFTTKSAGTGLGLAICRSILEKCGALIEYSKSFTLGGACFTIRYPKP